MLYVPAGVPARDSDWAFDAPAHAVEMRRATTIRLVRTLKGHFADLLGQPANTIPNNPIPDKGIQIAERRVFGNKRRPTAFADPVVAIVIVTLVAAPPGVTELGDTLQVVCGGDPEQLSFMALVNAPPRGATVSK